MRCHFCALAACRLLLWFCFTTELAALGVNYEPLQAVLALGTGETQSLRQSRKVLLGGSSCHKHEAGSLLRPGGAHQEVAAFPLLAQCSVQETRSPLGCFCFQGSRLAAPASHLPLDSNFTSSLLFLPFLAFLCLFNFPLFDFPFVLLFFSFFPPAFLSLPYFPFLSFFTPFPYFFQREKQLKEAVKLQHTVGCQLEQHSRVSPQQCCSPQPQ